MRKHRKIVLDIIKKIPIKNLFKPFYAGQGTILFMHKIISEEKNYPRISLMKGNELNVDFLEELIKHLKRKKYEFISLDEMVHRLDENKKNKNKFVVFTFDDGYKDNYTLAYPLFKKYNIPFTVYITNCYPNNTAKLWWYMLEDIILENKVVELVYGSVKETFLTALQNKKDSAFIKIRESIISASKEVQNEMLLNLEKTYGKNLKQYVEKESLSWEEIIELAKDDLVTIGCHTLNHYALNTLDKDEILYEIIASKQELEGYINKDVNHFAYPYGMQDEASSREIKIVEDSKIFATATTTRLGNIFKAHNNDKFALPRIQIIGTQQDISIFDMYICGMLPAIKNKLKRVVTL